MTWILSDSGTSSQTVGGGEQTLAADTTNGTFVLQVETALMALGDLIELRVYTINLSGGALTQSWKGTYQNPQINNEKISPPIASDQSIKCTINQPAGTARALPWKMLRI